MAKFNHNKTNLKEIIKEAVEISGLGEPPKRQSQNLQQRHETTPTRRKSTND